MTDKADAGTIGASGPTRAANTARTAVVWEALKELLAQLGDREPLEIVDAGGGTGGVAVPLAELGHRVTVVEPSPDSLAALERRAAEHGVTVRGVQGETSDLASLFAPAIYKASQYNIQVPCYRRNQYILPHPSQVELWK